MLATQMDVNNSGSILAEIFRIMWGSQKCFVLGIALLIFFSIFVSVADDKNLSDKT